ncbi:SDR family oxidoreductase [Carbonactinospora thermoautotrophica]|uniref:SDR family oxidoreductase n=1 Tax=Carbonactinospora thermoautotrophica TaxID=1469144 RepID=UPI003DA833C5
MAQPLKPLGNVLITGGASGLGAAAVEAVAADGGIPLIIDRVPPAQPRYQHEIVDLADTRAAEKAVQILAERNGGIDAVFTAAGTDSCGTLRDVPAAQWERVVQVNLLGTAAVVRAALPYLERVGGRIVTCASTLGIKAVSDATAYCASKFGVVITLLVPGGMRTRFFDDREEKYKPPADARLNRPEDVAAAVLFALRQPPGCEVREMVVCPSVESSWP